MATDAIVGQMGRFALREQLDIARPGLVPGSNHTSAFLRALHSNRAPWGNTQPAAQPGMVDSGDQRGTVSKNFGTGEECVPWPR